MIRSWRSLPETEPAADDGFFGPDSVTPKVWGYQMSLSIDFQRGSVIEEFDPALIAPVDHTHATYDRLGGLVDGLGLSGTTLDEVLNNVPQASELTLDELVSGFWEDLANV